MSAPEASPPTPSQTDLAFALIADSHVSDRQFQGRAKFARLVDAINDAAAALAGHGRRLAFVQLLGDLKLPSATTPEELLGGIDPPVHMLFGNNDFEPARGRLARYLSGQTIGYGSFECDGRLFVCLDTAVAGQHIGVIPEAQKRWLTDLLATTDIPGGRTVVFGHVPPGPPREPIGPMLMDLDARSFLEDTFRRHRPAAAFFGHLHHPERFDLGGVPVHVLPSSCWNFDPRLSLCAPRALTDLERETEAAPPSFTLVTAGPSGYTTEIVPLTTDPRWTNRLALDKPGASPEFI